MGAGWTVGRVKEKYLKYENAGDELVGRILTGIPPTSYEFGISPVCFKQTTENLNDVDNFVIPAPYPLAQFLYFAFCGHCPNYFSFVKTSSPWQNEIDSPVITGIPIHFSLLNRLMEVHRMKNSYLIN